MVIAINGNPVSPDHIPPLPSGLLEGRTLLYTVQRGEQMLEVPITLMRVGAAGYVYNMQWRFQNDLGGHFLAALSFLVAAFTFFIRPRNLGARYLFLVFGFFLAITLFGFSVPALFESIYPPALIFLNQLEPSSWFWYFFPSMTLMALSFLVIKAPLRRFPRLLPTLLYGVPGVTTLIVSVLVVITHDRSWENYAIPFFLAIAITRYRLFDIDIIIRRTLQYALVTGLPALTYFGGIVLLQSGFRALTGQTNSPLITVLATMGIAALFNPLRNRVQDFIDRRFYHKKYNAVQALAKFSETARDEVDMDKLTAALIGVVQETVQPENVSLWLKEMLENRKQKKAGT